MSETSGIEPTVESPSQVERKKHELSPQMRGLALTGIVLLALGGVSWALGIRADSIRRETFGRGVDALAASMTYSVIELQSQRFENRGERLQLIVDEVARAGRYEKVVVADPQGAVLATTDSQLRGQVLESVKDLKAPAKVETRDGRDKASTPIQAKGGQTLGYLFVTSKP
ncbi:MAG: hypothetical protein KIT11_02500 [Fimbriimonadaceae bacterium]|nr:hypothetical protein [Fimbriimonadaceae bacterium]QYK54762.1 MAG: hypothetical protein KF733_07035 [Fimbriimonadaceae bacterium]